MRPERSWRAATREAGYFLAALAPCPVIAILAAEDRTEALARGRALVDVGRDLGLFPEPGLHAWAEGLPVLLGAAWVVYLLAHLPAVAGALAWAWLERPAAYRAARNVFLVAQGLTVALYLTLPTAPPRLIPELGMGDGSSPARPAQHLQSPWAALPSGHVVFALVAAGIVAALVRRPLVRALACLYPPLVAAVTLLTANHFWIDAVLAAAVVAAAAAAVLVPRTVLVPRRQAYELGE
jgi:hypothetical protein